MGIYRVLLMLNGRKMDVYTDAPNAEIAAAIITVQLQREGYKNFTIISAKVVGGG